MLILMNGSKIKLALEVGIEPTGGFLRFINGEVQYHSAHSSM